MTCAKIKYYTVVETLLWSSPSKPCTADFVWWHECSQRPGKAADSFRGLRFSMAVSLPTLRASARSSSLPLLSTCSWLSNRIDNGISHKWFFLLSKCKWARWPPGAWWWGPAYPAALLCALLGSHEEGAKTPFRRCCYWPVVGTVNCSDSTFLGLTTCHSEAKQAAALHTFWNRQGNRFRWPIGNFQSLTLKMFVNTPENVTWMSTHVHSNHYMCTVPAEQFFLIIWLNFAEGRVAWALFIFNFIWILFQF